MKFKAIALNWQIKIPALVTKNDINEVKTWYNMHLRRIYILDFDRFCARPQLEMLYKKFHFTFSRQMYRKHHLLVEFFVQYGIWCF